MDFAQALKQYRKQTGLTQDEFSERYNLSYKQVQMYEQGRSKPKPSTLSRIAQAMGISVEELLAGPA